MSQQPSIPRKALSDTSFAVHRPSQSESSTNQVPYHDEPDAHDDDERPNTPPPYSGPSTPSIAGPSQPSTTFRSQPQAYPGLPRLDYRAYLPSQHSFVLSSDKSNITSYAPVLSKSPTVLLPLLQALCTVPPKPVVRITGTNSSGVVDFDVKINCMNLIWNEDEKQRMNYVRLIAPGEIGWRGEAKETTTPTLMDLESWVKKFCSDRSGIKEFILERTIINWDASYLQGRLLSLISSTNYRGHTTVTFPLTHNKVIIHSPDKYNRFFSNVTKAFTGSKKYEVVKSVWPYADVGREQNGGGRRCVVQDEERWFLEWKSVMRYAVLGKRTGWVTSEDRLEELMEPRGGVEGKIEEWSH